MIDLGTFGHISFDLAFLSALFSIVIIDLILAGDNAVVIAMAVRSLPHEQRRKGFLHAIYGGRWDDPAEYDHVFSVAGHSVDLEVKAVIDALVHRAVTGEAQKALGLRTAAARVKAGIATDPSFFIPVFDVLPDGEGLVLRGITHTPKEHKRIEEAARQLAGGLTLRFELHYRK